MPGLGLASVFKTALFCVASLAAFVVAISALAGETSRYASFYSGVSEVARGAPDAPRESAEEPAKPGEMMTASYYGREFAGLPTASGPAFDPKEYTAAHKSLPLGTKLLVSHEGESVRVTVTDRGPYIKGREIDLSRAAAKEIGLIRPGTGEVRVTEQ